MKMRKVCVFTGNRAEYGLQMPILRAIDAHPHLDYRLVVSGAHLDDNFGNTLEEIRSDGFEVHAEVSIDMPPDSQISTAQAIGSGVLSISQALNAIQPDIFVVYADRFEGFAAVIASTQMNIVTAHIEGGDITEGGALDDSVRHAMTKLSHLHFTTNHQATNRILAMGEDNWRVFTVGFPAIDLIKDGNFATAEEVITRFSLQLDKPIIIFTQHSVTTEFDKASEQLKPSLKAMQILAERGVQVVVTYPNNDVGGRKIIDEISASCDHQNIGVYPSIGRYYYHGFLALALNQNSKVVCVGNSSSGIKETPAFGCPCVNIGSRQKGRLRAENVIDVDYVTEEIVKAVDQCINDEEFIHKCMSVHNPYGVGDAGIKIADELARVELNQDILRKGMTLKGETNNGWYR